MKRIYVLFLLAGLFLLSCTPKKSGNVSETDSTNYTALDTLVKKTNFEKMVDGKQVDLYTLKNEGGVTIKITNFGGCIVQVLTKDKHGKYADITLGYSSLDGYQHDKMFLGATVGRYANRIARGTFKLDGKIYKLALNDGKNTLHGGLKGFNKVVWNAIQEGNKLTLTYVSPDMQEGYPGELHVTVTYTLTPLDELLIDFQATTNKKTIINLTNHAYYNLAGEGSGSILGHELQILGDKITPVDETLIPTGKFMDVENTPFDFRVPKTIGKDINDTLNQQIKFGRGYDHNWVLNKPQDSLRLAARLTETTSGRVMELWTTQPGLQFYSGNFMDGTVIGKSGKPYAYRNALALEPQHFPDSPNQPAFPSVVLNPGQTYHQQILLKFLADTTNSK